MSAKAITRDEAIGILRCQAQALRDRGIVQLALVGSVARDAARPDSDVDVLVDIDGKRAFSLIDHSDLRLFLCDLLDRDTDVIIRDSLAPEQLAHIQRDATVVF